MIFVAVGTQFPFDRLIRYIDEWAENNNEKVIAQMGKGASYIPKNIEHHEFIDNIEYDRLITEARVLVSHAGMGNIFTAKKLKTPIIVINRLFKFNEHINDHQTDGIAWMSKIEGVYTATSSEELYAHLENTELKADNNNAINQNNAISDFIRSFINENSSS